MRVKNIRLINYRNYIDLNLKLEKKLNLFIGNNAQGKTNLLESIYMCGFGKSFRKNKDKDIINIVANSSYIGADIEKSGGDKKIEIKLEREKIKRVKINRLELEKISDISGVFNVVIFSPEDLKIIKEGPAERRAFMDNEISQIRPLYKHYLSRYNKILQQRNNLLRAARYDKKRLSTISVWNNQLSRAGAEIIKMRLEFIETLSEISKEIHKSITGGIEDLEVRYAPSFEVKDGDLALHFEELLTKSVDEDVDKGTTSIGPHRDDILLFINNRECRVFGSQGQQRTAALSLKLAEVESIKLETGEYPVLLLDDVLSELDLNRRKYLIKTFKEVQTIITSTDDIDLRELDGLEKKVFKIKEGKVLET